MGMQDLNVDRLGLSFSNVQGHEHRIRPIAARAAAIFAERVEVYCGNAGPLPAARNVGSVSAAPLNLNLRTMTDEQAAQSIATAWLEALALRLM